MILKRVEWGQYWISRSEQIEPAVGFKDPDSVGLCYENKYRAVGCEWILVMPWRLCEEFPKPDYDTHIEIMVLFGERLLRYDLKPRPTKVI